MEEEGRGGGGGGGESLLANVQPFQTDIILRHEKKVRDSNNLDEEV